MGSAVKTYNNILMYRIFQYNMFTKNVIWLYRHIFPTMFYCLDVVYCYVCVGK